MLIGEDKMGFNWHKEAEKQWDQKASFWNKNSQNMWDEGSRKTIIPFLSNYVPGGSRIADIGCGDGYGSYKLNQAGYDVVGLDISTEMVEKAKARLENESLHFVQGDIAKLPFETESFDALMAINSLEWTEQPAKALEELIRIIKKEGHLCVGILGPTAKPRMNSYKRLYGETVICNTMMPWEFEQLAQELGIEVVDGQGVYKREVNEEQIKNLPNELKQALTFMWLFVLKKV